VGKKIRVLIADDNSMVRSGLSNLLKFHSDMEIVGEAADGLEAVAGARVLFPDIILMDINMPNMSGLAATRIISAELPETRIIGLSLNHEPETISAMREAGAADHLAKGCDFCMVLDAIRKYVTAQTP